MSFKMMAFIEYDFLFSTAPEACILYSLQRNMYQFKLHNSHSLNAYLLFYKATRKKT
jgi:hypothetical protein